MTGVADDILRPLPAHRRELFEIRTARWWADLRDGLQLVYGESALPDLERRVARSAAEGYARRDPELQRLDLVRTLSPDWFQAPRMVGYSAYADRFAGDLRGVAGRIPYLRELGVTYLHLMPLLATRDGNDDGGYAVSDYRRVRDDLGTVDDLRALAGELRHAGISLVVDLVLNHVAREHAWAAAARAGDPRRRRYFLVFPDRQLPDAFERTLPEVFPDFARGSFTWDADLDGWVWTTFNSWQWDLDWSNPDVFVEFVDIVLFLANLGVEVLRLDAVAFLWKRLGTDCQNQPEVHAIVQALRAVCRIACPAVAFKAEAIVAPSQLVAYLGTGRRAGKVSDLAYNNVLMVQVWSMLAEHDVRLAAHTLGALPEIPAGTAWVTYVRGHDDIGWAVDDADAAAVGLAGAAHRAFLADYYAGIFPGSSAAGLVFQHNLATGDRRISGGTGTLAGLQRAVHDGDRAAVDAAVDRILLAYAIVFGWGGIPVVWMGDELGLLDDPTWAADPAHAGDNRWSHRPRFDLDAAARRHDPRTVPGRIFAGMARLSACRAAMPALHARGERHVLPVADHGVLGVVRRVPGHQVLQLYNVAAEPRPWPVDAARAAGTDSFVDAISEQPVDVAGDQLWLPAYAAAWFARDL